MATTLQGVEIDEIISGTKDKTIRWRALPPNVWIAKGLGDNTLVLQYYKGTYTLDVLSDSLFQPIGRKTLIKFDSILVSTITNTAMPYLN